MRRSAVCKSGKFKLLVVDDDICIINTIVGYLKNSDYVIDFTTDPLEAIEKVKNNKYDILLLDFMIGSMHGDEVVRSIREFNKELYILLLTGYKSMVPPMETIKSLDIQGYCEKSDNLEQLELLLASAAKSIIQKNTISKFKDGLASILNVVPNIYKLSPIEYIIMSILEGLLPFVNGKNAFLLVDNIINDDENSKRFFYKELRTSELISDEKILDLNPGVLENLGQARAERRTIIAENKIVIPLKDEKGYVVGILYVEGSSDIYGIKLLELYAIQAASAICNASLHMLINLKNQELDKTYEELKGRYIDTIEALRLTVDAKDSDTRGHSDRVSFNAALFGKMIGLSEEDIEILRVGGVFHDIGKIGIADDILLKEGILSKEEFEEIKMHPKRGAHILSVISLFENVTPIVKYHHERFDGTGYPYGLEGEKIPYLARIISIIDAYDAMISNRKYRNRLDVEKAKEQLRKGAGTQFDAKIVKDFLEMLENPLYLNRMFIDDEKSVESISNVDELLTAIKF